VLQGTGYYQGAHPVEALACFIQRGQTPLTWEGARAFAIPGGRGGRFHNSWGRGQG